MSMKTADLDNDLIVEIYVSRIAGPFAAGALYTISPRAVPQ